MQASWLRPLGQGCDRSHKNLLIPYVITVPNLARDGTMKGSKNWIRYSSPLGNRYCKSCWGYLWGYLCISLNQCAWLHWYLLACVSCRRHNNPDVYVWTVGNPKI